MHNRKIFYLFDENIRIYCRCKQWLWQAASCEKELRGYHRKICREGRNREKMNGQTGKVQTVISGS